MRARVVVTLKSGVLDPQGKAIEGALGSLGIAGMTDLRQGKVFDLVLDEEDPETARAKLTRVCERLLANTVVEDYRITIGSTDEEPAGNDGGPEPENPVPAVASAAEAAEMPAEGHP